MGNERGGAGAADSTAGVSSPSEDLFRLVVESVRDYAVFATDAEGRILSWNPGVLHLLGYEEREWVGRHASASTTRTQGGLGLGLSIVRHIVELHGGTVVAESGGKGLGATFTVTLPVVGRSASWADNNVDGARHEGNDEECPPSLEGLHVLVLDDEEDTREVVAAILNKCGARVTTAASAAEAFDALTTGGFDLIVSDIGMPGVDGYEFIRTVRTREREAGAHQTPAVALTAYAREEDRLKAFRAGFQMHMTKPVGPGELTAVVASFSGRTQGQGGQGGEEV